jgi:hypothetical protein
VRVRVNLRARRRGNLRVRRRGNLRMRVTVKVFEKWRLEREGVTGKGVVGQEVLGRVWVVLEDAWVFVESVLRESRPVRVAGG